MGKRSDFERSKMDYYATPMEAVRPLLPHLPPETWYCEPCAGEGVLIGHLQSAGHKCMVAFDAGIGPFRRHDAAWITEEDLRSPKIEMIITNPPWDRKPLHQIIERCARLRPTWLLFDADWMHTQQAQPHLEICRMIISVGRVKWFGDTSGKDNCCWYLFDAKGAPHKTIFMGKS
jgi:hypothetical protein